ncbi:histidine phosphatase family protein [Vreelandella populi]|uniref:Histidine phosphatase family protein n=1 Tax=Vreelandella populi TaxID=2498858 RepID=A0A3S0YNS2_9GAMM|nr:histidine phosphatase family protein [Halomonas populi]RUR35533.1 histidine phosphatase family protein [Halomonas populi]RUR47723.1 histidine phosphatase family protein [Halomonas populi]RUR54414.1 histidine phosphatase family protein [Halomonas populi]
MSNTFLTSSDHWRNRYLLMRHGHSQANQQRLVISSPERGVEAFGLSAIGEQQLVKTVDDWSWPTPTRVVHSDFLRTTQTAARVANAFQLAMTPDKRLRERFFGELEGLTDKHYPDVWALDAQDAEHNHYQVESVSTVATRMLAVLEDLEQQSEGETILIVSHGDPLQILLTALKGRPLSQHREQPALLPASITRVGVS